MDRKINRRDFNKLSSLTGLGLVAGGSSAIMASSANSKVVLAVAGIHSRGLDLTQKFSGLNNCSIKYVIDVDNRYLPKAADAAEENQGKRPLEIKDFRKALDDKNVDGLIIATPEQWHAPMAIEAVKAGKHVYVEKPCSHNPAEGEMLIKAEKKYDKVMQMGNQRRSFKVVEQMIREIHEGLIGDVYFARAWYARKRGPIGMGKVVPVPDYLDWDLWQGPAPRTDYRDNIHPYNWHWFWNWGTGEALNNGTHELDVARWGLEVDYPSRVTSLGGRFHYPDQDDWEFFDTQNITLEFPEKKMITWEALSGLSVSTCSGDRGVMFCGTKGRIEYLSSSYKVFDLDGELISDVTGLRKSADDTNTSDPGLNDYHAENFIDAILGKDTINSPMTEGHKSVLLGHLGNIAAKTGTLLNCNPKNGHIIGNPEAEKMWSREYEPGWEPKV
ncbi:MAG: Gfo/Idh/MocA family protein [Planctomycetota bacterium]|jgi:predicted dehydrogenase